MSLLFSTRSASAPIDAPEAILRGIAPDGGLYTPAAFPRINPSELAGKSFLDISAEILSSYLDGYTSEEIKECVRLAYSDKFDDTAITPIKEAGGLHFLELFHGPTAAFKDIALSILPFLMTKAAGKKGLGKDIVILTATSGDTGSSAMRGFMDVEGTRVLAFYPESGISPIQKAQMTTIGGSNTLACGVTGNFDSTQTMVKRIFNEIPREFCEKNNLVLSSANSINFGRLAPQIVYYYSAYIQLVERGVMKMGEKASFCVPTGNFGDILAGYFAKLSGLPIDKLICASNRNNVLTEFFNTGAYDKNRPFFTTSSPSMDILVSSNLERLLYHALGNSPDSARNLMEKLAETGSYQLPPEALASIKGTFQAGFCNEEQTKRAIKEVFLDTGYLMDPHTAVARHVARSLSDCSSDCSKVPCVVLSTASPFKFPSTVLEALGAAVPASVPAQLQKLQDISHAGCPDSLKAAASKAIRFHDVVAPEHMMAYVMKMEAKR